MTKHFDPALLPFAPLLYVAWSDGALDAHEMAAIRERTRADVRLDPAAKAALERWLDPQHPPGPAQLSSLLAAVRGAGARIDPDLRESLADIGAALARQTPAGELAPTQLEALRELELALGVVSPEAARAVLPMPEAGPPAPPPPFEAEALRAFIDRDHLDVRRRMLSLLATPEFAYVDDRDHGAYREQVLAWCRRLAQEGFGALPYPAEFGGQRDVGRSIAAFETLGFHDLSLLVKFGVQFGLFAGSIFQLGTRRHHQRYLRAAATLELPGCFAMTETAHGSNVRDLETTATYDPAAGEFVVHTPHDDARKDYIGNAALHARMATVFAQLRTGTESHGVHAFLVPLRDEHGEVLRGVSIEDCGPKEGLNGVDNGRIRFDAVRIPRENLLDRFGSVDADGGYRSPISSPARRFFTMLGTLVAGRVSIAAAALSAAKSGLTIAVRYADRRRQFGPEGRPEVPILDYLVMQRSLLPRLAAAYALDFALSDLVRQYTTLPEDTRRLEGLAAGLKAISSRNTVETLQACREATGGQGYLSVNRIAGLRADTDVFTTFEGANPVLLQLLARSLLTEYREEFGDIRLWGAVRYVAGRAATALAERNPIATRRTDPDHLRDPGFHLAAFRYREARLLGSLGRRLRHRIGQGEDSFAALNACQDHAVALARAHIERVICECMADGIAAAPLDLVPVLGQLAALYGLWRLEADRGWFLEHGYFEGPKARAIRSQVNALCGEIRPYAVLLVDAFGIPDALLASPIAAR